ncbi:hypothetical protein [Rufibacter roseolus]|uniref:hypothetical protein n=1 Tax=Rufibacter roseolus TaxID=2817375 RepID=UPI001B30AD21|nr:hypothetical protein [Rufibacter roseolus]
MKEIIRYLFENSDQRECFYDSLGNVTFTFNQIYVSVNFDEELEFEDSFNYIRDVIELDEIVEGRSLSEFRICLSEYLGAREDVISFNENDKKYYYSYLPISITNSILILVRELRKLINPHIVKNYRFDINNPSGGFCNTEPNYEGYIYILVSLVNLEAVKSIVAIFKKIKLLEIPCNYCITFIKEHNVKNDFEAQFINTSTKVRRLGYLKLFSSFIYERKRIPESFLNRKFEQYALLYNSHLDEAINAKGIIQDANGKSAAPYIELLKELDLITTVNRVVVPTKWLRVYLALNENDYDESLNAFLLNDLDKLFFLEIILKKDFLYFSLVLEYVYSNDSISIKDLIKNFQGLLLERISALQQQIGYRNTKAISELKVIEKRVLDWKKAEVYLEHIIMPRINWMLDLRLIDLENGLIQITENGKRLCIELCYWIDIGAEYVTDSSDFIRRFYPAIYFITYKGSPGVSASREEILSRIVNNIEKSFVLFKTLAPNRVTSSQAITYSKYQMCLSNGYAVSERFHIKMLETELREKFIYKYQPQYSDGYIQNINK